MNRHIDTQAGTEMNVQSLGQQTMKAQMAFTAAIATVCFVVMMALSSVVRADSGADIVWTASKVEGSVNYREGGHPDTRWVPLRVGALLSSLAELKTGSNGRAELSFEGSTIVAAPNSEFHLPGPTPRNAVYRVSQKVGTFLYKIKHATRDKFEVQTPYLTTIIKGTIFTVLAGPSGSGGAFVRPGETARVAGAQRGKVTIQGANRKSGSSNAPKNDQRSDASGSSNGASKVNSESNSGQRRGKPVKIVFRSTAPQVASLGGNGPVNTNNRGRKATVEDNQSKGQDRGNVGGAANKLSGNGNGNSGSSASGGGNGGGASAGLGGGSSSNGGGNGNSNAGNPNPSKGKKS